MTAPTLSLDGRVVLVTGAASGIGEAIAKASAAAGASAVVLLDRDAEHLEEVRAEVAGTDGAPAADAAVVDIADAPAVHAAVAAAAEKHGRIDAAFLNAGINAGAGIGQPGGGIDELDLETWNRVMAINLTGTFSTMQAVAAVMKRQRSGSIVTTSSSAGLRTEPLVSYAYQTAKAAVVSLTRAAAVELSAYGVRVNSIAPGPVNTNIGGRRPRHPEKTALWERSIPMRRFGDPDELTGLALLLASDAGSYMTGGTYVIDGGASALTQVLSGEIVRDLVPSH
ncbi:SDR family NAD(P)-dependent oxidoreductase [Georgenia alba]|uniref:SDR family NAD(P)-dependent oxidoreductase n=1 Tax=Georgenia alba TaxID=2233858 RepID=A0ABW2Q5I7_9MICO